MFTGDAAAHGVLQPGDELVTVHGKSFATLSHYSAWNFLKALPEGRIKMLIRRK